MLDCSTAFNMDARWLKFVRYGPGQLKLVRFATALTYQTRSKQRSTCRLHLTRSSRMSRRRRRSLPRSLQPTLAHSAKRGQSLLPTPIRSMQALNTKHGRVLTARLRFSWRRATHTKCRRPPPHRIRSDRHLREDVIDILYPTGFSLNSSEQQAVPPGVSDVQQEIADTLLSLHHEEPSTRPSTRPARPFCPQHKPSRRSLTGIIAWQHLVFGIPCEYCHLLQAPFANRFVGPILSKRLPLVRTRRRTYTTLVMP